MHSRILKHIRAATHASRATHRTVADREPCTLTGGGCRSPELGSSEGGMGANLRAGQGTGGTVAFAAWNAVDTKTNPPPEAYGAEG